MHIVAPTNAEVDLARALPRNLAATAGTELTFGRFVALPAARTLLLDGQIVCIGARAFDLLILLLSARGEIVSKDAIMRHVWPTTTVDESNLRFQVTCLRRALGEERDRIKTITGRGYLFVPEEPGSETQTRLPRWGEYAPNAAHTAPKCAIVIIDQDPANRQALHRLLQPFAADVLSFVSIEAFRDSGSAPAQ